MEQEKDKESLVKKIIIGIIIIGAIAIIGIIANNNKKVELAEKNGIENQIQNMVETEIYWKMKQQYDFKNIKTTFTTVERKEDILTVYAVVDLIDNYNEKYTAKYNGKFGELQYNDKNKVTQIENNLTTPIKSK